MLQCQPKVIVAPWKWYISPLAKVITFLKMWPFTLNLQDHNMIQLAVLELNLQNSSPTVLFTTDIEIDSHHFDIDITWRGEIDFHSLCPSCFRSPFPLPALHHCPVLQMPEKAQKTFSQLALDTNSHSHSHLPNAYVDARKNAKIILSINARHQLTLKVILPTHISNKYNKKSMHFQ